MIGNLGWDSFSAEAVIWLQANAPIFIFITGVALALYLLGVSVSLWRRGRAGGDSKPGSGSPIGRDTRLR